MKKRSQISKAIHNLFAEYWDLSGYYFSCTDDGDSVSCGHVVSGCAEILSELSHILRKKYDLETSHHVDVFKYLHTTKEFSDFSNLYNKLTSTKVKIDYDSTADYGDFDIEELWSEMEKLFIELERVLN